jgi:predicted nucleic acid-binding protein
MAKELSGHMKTFVDSSTIIALSRIGELDLLRKLLGKIYITKSIEKELLVKKYPETEPIKKAIGDWIVSEKVKGNTKQYTKYGLGEGEATLFLTEKKARLVIDELNARRIADVENRDYIGLLGLIVAAVEMKKIDKEKAKDVIAKLAESDFRMTVALYKTIMEKIEKV